MWRHLRAAASLLSPLAWSSITYYPYFNSQLSSSTLTLWFKMISGPLSGAICCSWLWRVAPSSGRHTSYIVCDKRTSPPYKNRSYIHKTSDSLRWKCLSVLCKKTSDKECVQLFPVSPPTRTFSCAVFKCFSYFWRQCCVCSSVLIYNFRYSPDHSRKQ